MLVVFLGAVVNLTELRLHGFWHLFVTWAVVASILLATLRSELTLQDIGLGRAYIKTGLTWGLLALLGISVVLAAVYMVVPSAFTDHRYQAGWPHTAKTIFLTIPLVTVVAEEFLFRGVLLAVLRRRLRMRWSVLISSVLFGLWHIVPSLRLYDSSAQLGKTTAALGNAQVGGIVAAVVATTLAGAALCCLRLRSRSLLAAILAHWAVNACSVFLIALAYNTG
jgi:membrane protease YdiL (CAAX protease family)